ncbi:Capsule polysaccharide modification protein LipA [Nymphon striatum]|nr:Capsule polysaccharide modification protein LipA [Nymphon striatum]
MVWAGKAPAEYHGVRVEDGFLRSKGLGANLVPPLSLVCDDLGIYYDPQRPSRLERLIAASTDLRPDQLRRAENLIASLTAQNITKYNLAGARLALPNGYKILVPGQVEDDASILTGSTGIQTNSDLLARARAENPDATILYKPHPDVEAGLRKGKIENALTWADMVLDQADIGDLFGQVDEVWTMTSLMGFEALLRGLKVTTVGAPFYAGWGLTRDLGKIPPRRRANVPIQALVHATLIALPKIFRSRHRQSMPCRSDC